MNHNKAIAIIYLHFSASSNKSSRTKLIKNKKKKNRQKCKIKWPLFSNIPWINCSMSSISNKFKKNKKNLKNFSILKKFKSKIDNKLKKYNKKYHIMWSYVSKNYLILNFPTIIATFTKILTIIAIYWSLEISPLISDLWVSAISVNVVTKYHPLWLCVYCVIGKDA